MSSRKIKLVSGKSSRVPKQHQSARPFPDHTETTSDRALYQQVHQRRHTDRGNFSVNGNPPKLGGKKK